MDLCCAGRSQNARKGKGGDEEGGQGELHYDCCCGVNTILKEHTAEEFSPDLLRIL